MFHNYLFVLKVEFVRKDSNLEDIQVHRVLIVLKSPTRDPNIVEVC